MTISNNNISPAITNPSLIEECSDRHNELGKHLRQEREARGMTVRQLASKAKLSYSELSRIENGKKMATPSTLRKLSPYLSIPMDILLLEAGYSFQTDKDGSIYVDLDGKEISLEKNALKIYSKNVEFFFQLDNWMEQCDDDDVELVIKFLQILVHKNCIKQNFNNTTQSEMSFLKLYDGLQSLIQAGSSM